METLLRQQGLEWVRTITESPSSGRGLYQVKQSALGLVYSLKRVPIVRGQENTIENLAMNDGMITMKQDGYLKVLEGITTMEEVIRVAQV